VQWTQDAKAPPGDVVPPAFKLGERLEMSQIPRLQGWLPDEVWERREKFFFEGMQLEVGPCYRRFPEPSYFSDATRAGTGQAKLDADGNLLGYSGSGLPFAPDSLEAAAADVAQKLAWDYRYRYQAAGFRGDFRITQITEGGRDSEQYSGTFFFLPRHGIPGAQPDDKQRFAAGGAFQRPETARGLAWRQYQLTEVESDYKASDEVFVGRSGARRRRMPRASTCRASRARAASETWASRHPTVSRPTWATPRSRRRSRCARGSSAC
jgi:hypothetical protein